MAAKIKPAQLRDAFKADLNTCWQYARSLHPKDTPYAFALHGLEGTPHLYPYVLTEEGLTKVAKRYVADGYHETVAAARKELRYSMEDSIVNVLPATVPMVMPALSHCIFSFGSSRVEVALTSRVDSAPEGGSNIILLVHFPSAAIVKLPERICRLSPSWETVAGTFLPSTATSE